MSHRLVDDRDAVAVLAEQVAERTGIPASHIEKDFWVTEVLRGAAAMATASNLERWLHWFCHAAEYTPEELKELLPYPEFQEATDKLHEFNQTKELRMLYDAREKKRRDYESIITEKYQEGRQEGRHEGEFRGKISVIEQLLHLPETSKAALDEKSVEELQSLLTNLQKRLRLSPVDYGLQLLNENRRLR